VAYVPRGWLHGGSHEAVVQMRKSACGVR
jgi:hypothetical protein